MRLRPQLLFVRGIAEFAVGRRAVFVAAKNKKKADDSWSPSLFAAEIKKSIWSDDKERGRIRDILFQDITVAGNKNPPSHLFGCDAEHANILFKNVALAGRPIANAEAYPLKIGKHVSDVRFE